MVLKDLFPGYVVENQEFECKRTISKDETQMIDWMKCIAGMSNNKGGDFFIGVEDQSLKLVGFELDELDKERNFFNNAVNEHLSPRPTFEISFIPYKVRDKERFIIQVHIIESNARPIILKYKGVPAIYMHRNGFTNGATYEEIVDMSVKSKDTEYDKLSSDIKYDPNDFTKLQAFYKEHTQKDRLSDKALESMGFYDGNGYLSNGAVLFMDEYNASKTRVHCSLFKGLTRGDDRIITLNVFEGNIIDSISYMMDFVNLRMNHSIIKQTQSRIDIDAYPKRALFEGIINAIAHRDYFIDGSQIQIDMFIDRLEISSPGSFYKGAEIKKTYDLQNIMSKRRNNLICDVLVACEVMEAAGTGFEKIIKEYEKQDMNHRPYVVSSSDHFRLVLPDITYEKGLSSDDLPSIIYPAIENGSIHDEKILSFCYKNGHSVNEIAEKLGISPSSYFRKTILQNLISQGYLLTSKQGKKVLYKTDEDTVLLK